MFYRLQDMADELGDLIGSNDPEAANMAYAIAGRMRDKALARVDPKPGTLQWISRVYGV